MDSRTIGSYPTCSFTFVTFYVLFWLLFYSLLCVRDFHVWSLSLDYIFFIPFDSWFPWLLFYNLFVLYCWYTGFLLLSNMYHINILLVFVISCDLKMRAWLEIHYTLFIHLISPQPYMLFCIFVLLSFIGFMQLNIININNSIY